MLYLTCTTITSIDVAHYGVSRVKDWVYVKCGTRRAYPCMGRKQEVSKLRNPGRDISFPIFTRQEIETKRIRKEIKPIISRLKHFLTFLSDI